MKTIRFSMNIIIGLFLLTSAALAEDRSVNMGTVVCHASSCFKNSENDNERGIDAQIRNQEKIVEQTCSTGMIRSVGTESCMREQESLRGYQACASRCIQARCKSSQMVQGFYSGVCTDAVWW